MRILLCFAIFFSFCMFAHDYNLIIIVDNLQQETVKTEEINMTHQCITALQQRACLSLISTNLWKNIIDRKTIFEKNLQDPLSAESNILNLYQTTNQELKEARYNIAMINQKLSQAWFAEQFPILGALSPECFNQLRFNFLCYMFEFEMSHWRVYSAHAGMLLFIPQECMYPIEDHYELFDEHDMLKHAHQKSNVVQSLQKLLKNPHDRWVMYLSGHGHPKSLQQDANIAGLKIDEFKKLLHCLNDEMHLKLLLYSSCYGGGVHTIEPYANLKLHYPVIVTAATDAPTFGFGLFEGVKLPPYDEQFKLELTDVLKNYGLLPYAMQNYTAFFKRAWKGLFDVNLVQLISRFFTCDLFLCHVQKIENFPLIRKAHNIIFTPIRDEMMTKLVEPVMTNRSITSNKPLLLYTKKVKKIKIDRAVPIISMLPGIQSHGIGELEATQVSLSALIAESFLSLEDRQAYKNFLLNKIICFNDVTGDKKIATLSHFLVLDQTNLRPNFLEIPAQSLIYFQCEGCHYLLLWSDKKITDQIILNENQIDSMAHIILLVQRTINYDAHSMPEKLLTFDAYLDNKAYQQGIVDGCIKTKICKK